MANKTINIPDLGEAEDVEVIEICAKVGDQVDSEDPIIVLESDKAAMEIPASAIGKVISIEVSVGDTVNSGLPFLQIEVSDDAAEKDEKAPPNNTDKKNHTVNEESENIKSEQLANLEKPKNSLNTSNTNNANIYAGPAVRKLAREFGN
jgi:pyruvate dehydrogenase E2 component (dihydrolipoamide acetyltransferase)